MTTLRPLTAAQKDLLDTIDHVVYVIECIGQNIGGEAKYELHRLTEAVANSGSAQADIILADLRKAADLLAEAKYPHAVAPLARVRGVLWKTLLA